MTNIIKTNLKSKICLFITFIFVTFCMSLLANLIIEWHKANLQQLKTEKPFTFYSVKTEELKYIRLYHNGTAYEGILAEKPKEYYSKFSTNISSLRSKATSISLETITTDVFYGKKTKVKVIAVELEKDYNRVLLFETKTEYDRFIKELFSN